MSVEILDWPTNLVGVQSRGFQLMPRNLQSTALLTGDVSPAGPTDQRFVANLSFPPRGEAGWREASGLIAGRRGTVGFVRMGDPLRCHPYYNRPELLTTQNWDDGTQWDDGAGWESGFLPEFVAVKTAAVRGDRSIVLQGFPVSLSAVLRSGDLFEIRPNGVPAVHGHLYEVTRTANTDVSGDTRVYFEPGLRTGVAPGDMVVITNPKTVFRLASDDQGAIEVDSELFGHMGMSLVEVLPKA